MLKPLLLPKLVEERRRRESMLQENEMDFSPAFRTQNSSASDISPPATPTFSTRGHLRYSSSVSSMEVSLMNTPVTDSPASPIFVGLKRSLPDVQEEPQEREEDFAMLDYTDELYDYFCDDSQCGHHDPTMAQSSLQLLSSPEFDYDLADGFFSDSDMDFSPTSKKPRGGDSPFVTFASQIGRFPSFSRKWRMRRGDSTVSTLSDKQRDSAVSRGSRSSSFSNSVRQGLEKSHEHQLPPTPTQSILDNQDDDRDENQALNLIDIEKANRYDGQQECGATTPLLPPLMVDTATNSKQVAAQSPLQSPSVAEPSDPFSVVNTPIDGVTPVSPRIPSPPLSNKPSISSFHRTHLSRPGHLILSPEIPPIVIADVNDEWANKLGHANFTIQPEPYIPEVFDIEACKQLRANWDLARCNYMKHLARTGEHYGVTSKTYKLTEEKWAEIDGTWRKNNNLTVQNTAESGGDAFLTLKQIAFGDPISQNVMTRMPSLNDPTSGGKFPQLGDGDIVGPMVQVAARLQRSPSKKARIMKFLVDKFPAGLGRTPS